MTLLENLLYIDNKQGGTIHQYIDNYGDKKSLDFEQTLENDYLKHGGLVSYSTLNHYAENRGIWIKWSEDTRFFFEPSQTERLR